MFLKTSTIRMNGHFLMILIFLESVLLLSAQRSEMTADFVPTEFSRNKTAVSGLPKANAKTDMPELFDRKYMFSEQIIQDSVQQEINGYRIQIFRTEDLNEAKRRESIYIDTFGEDNVILIFEKPFYRIRVGRFRNKEEAEEFYNSLSQRGIQDAIIVPDRVKVLMPAENRKK